MIIINKNLRCKWTYSIFEDDFDFEQSFNTKEQAIANGKKYASLYSKDTIYIGQFAKVTPKIDTWLTESILLQIANQTIERVGNVAYDYLEDVTPEQIKELATKLNEAFLYWSIKNSLLPTYYEVVNIEAIKIS